MSELNHPEIKIVPQSQVSLEEAFVSSALTFYKLRHQSGSRKTGPNKSGADDAKWLDMAVSNDEVEDVALRIVATPTLESNSADITDTTTYSNKYFVLLLEHGKYENEIITAEQYRWEPYVMIVIERNNPDTLMVLDAKTGDELSNFDLLRATEVIDLAVTEAKERVIYETLNETAHSEIAMSTHDTAAQLYGQSTCVNCLRSGIR